MRRFHDAAVEKVFEGYPPAARRKLLALREMIFKTAAATEGVGELEEALRWNEPAYITTQSKSGSMVRLGWKKSKSTQYAMYFHCQTNLVETFRMMFPKDFTFDGNRAIIFNEMEKVPTDSLRICIAAALTYHQRKARTSRQP